MSGLSDYMAGVVCGFITGQQPCPTGLSRYIALFTTAPTTESGGGAVEVSGGSYARVQVAGQLTASASWTTSSTSITLSSPAPSWLTTMGPNGYGANVFDVTNGQQIGVVNTVSGSTVNLTTSAQNASSGSSDNIVLSAYPAAGPAGGLEPAIVYALINNLSLIRFPQSTANWGNVVAFGIYDSPTGTTNLLMWDYLGSFNWLSASVSLASPAVITTHAHGFSAGDQVVATTKYGGYIPNTSQSNFNGIMSVASTGLTTDSFTVTNSSLAVNTSQSGDILIKKVSPQFIPLNVTTYIPALSGSGGSFNLSFDPIG